MDLANYLLYSLPEALRIKLPFYMTARYKYPKKTGIKTSCYMPHQGKKEMERRVKQMAKLKK